MKLLKYLNCSGLSITQLGGIVDQKLKELKNKVIPMVKVMWRSDIVKEIDMGD